MTRKPSPLAGLLIADSGTIHGAMEAINANGHEMVLVRDRALRIAGLISDGDIRRGLLAGLTLASPATEVMTRDFVTVTPDVDRALVLDIMKARMLRYVPVLDASRRLVAVHFLRELIGAEPKPNIALVMAGGRGTRLRPVTEQIPKPLVEVAGRPVLERIVLHLVGHGVRTIYLAVHFKAEMIERHFGDGANFGCRIEYLREPVPLGTGGALSLLPERPKHPMLVLNGDLVTRADISAMLEAHRNSKCTATIGVGSYQVQIPYGTLTENRGRLASIEEKPTVNFLVNRGIYVLDPATLKLVPRNKEFPITKLFEALLKAKQQVGLFNFDDAWLDIGTPDELRRAQGWQ